MDASSLPIVSRILHLNGTPVGDVLAGLRGRRYDCAETVFVTDEEGRLEGTARINDLLTGGDLAFVVERALALPWD